jgi:hypothetical protein
MWKWMRKAADWLYTIPRFEITIVMRGELAERFNKYADDNGFDKKFLIRKYIREGFNRDLQREKTK